MHKPCSWPGIRRFGVWPPAQAAEACFGTDVWPKELSIPQAGIEFELKDAEALDAGVQELESYRFKLLHGAKTEPWGQIIARVLGRKLPQAESSRLGRRSGESNAFNTRMLVTLI